MTAALALAALRFTFIGNMAFHVTDGKTALLVDFPYQSGAFGYMEWSNATLPKGPAPLCVISHSHDDHFWPRLARDYCGSLLGPKDVVASGGVKSLELKDEVAWEGVVIRPLATKHAQVEHYSYLIEWEGRKLYFTGDTESTDALLAARGLDVAFVSPWLLGSVAKRSARIDTAHVVVYHHQADEAVPEIQGRLLPKRGDVLATDGKALRVIARGPEPPAPPFEPDEFEKLLREAKANIETPAGKAYHQGSFMAHFFSTHGPRYTQCYDESGVTEVPSFDIVLDLREDGGIAKARVRPEMKFTTCYLRLLEKETMPRPPAPSFRVPFLLQMRKP